MGKKIDLTGQRYNMLTVIEEAGRDKYGKILWRCKCDCGNEVVTLGRSLRNGHCKSCGCLKNAHRKEDGAVRGLSKTRIYRIWKGMRARCNNPNNCAYELYGAKGITLCEEWQGEQGFFNFLAWSLENGYREYLTIDRIDGTKGYEPNNCRWATWKQQRQNQHRTVAVNQYGIFPIKTMFYPQVDGITPTLIRPTTEKSSTDCGWGEPNE